MTQTKDILSGEANYTDSLRYAMKTAVSGDIIEFSASKFDSNAKPMILRDDLPVIGGSVDFIGTNSAYVVIDGNSQYKAFEVSNSSYDVTMMDISVQKSPAGIRVSNGTLTITNASIKDSTNNVDGGAFAVSGGTLTLSNVAISGCTAGTTAAANGGAIAVSGGTLNLESCQFENCRAGNEVTDISGTTYYGGSGGAIHASGGTVNMIDATFEGCVAGFNASGDGGSIFAADSELDFYLVSLDDSTAQDNGGGLAVTDGSTLVANYLTIDEAEATFRHGGGLYLSESTATLNESEFTGCVTLDTDDTGGGFSDGMGSGGGIAAIDSMLTMYNSPNSKGYTAVPSLNGCESAQFGGGIYFEGELTDTLKLYNWYATGCTAESTGGGIALYTGKLTIRNLDVRNCTATPNPSGDHLGGGIHIALGTADISDNDADVDFLDCDAQTGGGINTDHAELLIDGVSLKGCSAANGGGLSLHRNYNGGTGVTLSTTVRGAKIEDCTVDDDGGGIIVWENGEFYLQDSEIKDCTTTDNFEGRGGGISLYGPVDACEITNSTIKDCASKTVGGGIFSNGPTLVIRTSTIADNTASTSGGGVYATTPSSVGLVMEGVTVSGNSVGSNGGGIFFDDAKFFLTNCTVSGNTAGTGGGVFVGAISDELLFEFTTIANNSAVSGAGFYIDSVPTGTTPTLTFNATAFIGNSNDEVKIPELDDTTVTFNYCAMTTDTDIAASNGTYTLVDNNTLSKSTAAAFDLGSLADNGGPTVTHLPDDGVPSILIGVVPASSFSTQYDQRGLFRTGSMLDIGSVQTDGTALPSVTGFTVNQGYSESKYDIQRSMLTKIEITFSAAVSASYFTQYSAITLTRTTARPIDLTGTVVQTGATGPSGRITAAQGSSNTVILTFDNANGALVTSGVEANSLADGRWQLAVPGAGYQSTLGDTTLRRLFGDFDNSGTLVSNGTVDSNDYAAFGSSLGFNFTQAQYILAFDFDHSGAVDALDLAAFGNRFGVTL